MPKALKLSVVTALAVFIFSIFPQVASAQEIPGSLDSDIDQTPSNTDEQPNTGEQLPPDTNELLHKELESIFAEEGTFGSSGIVSEDPVINQLADFTNVLAETDLLSEPELTDLAIQGIVVELDSNSPLVEGLAGDIEPLLKLPSVPLAVKSIHPGIIKAELTEGNFYLQKTPEVGVYKSATQVLIEITDAENDTFTFPLNIPAGVNTKHLQSNQILFSKSINGRATIVGYIDSPWAIDAAGNSVPITQKIVNNNLVVAVDTKNAVFPVIADPKWIGLNSNELEEGLECGDDNRSYLGSAADYINGKYCPSIEFVNTRYMPTANESWENWYVGRGSKGAKDGSPYDHNGGCGGVREGSEIARFMNQLSKEAITYLLWTWLSRNPIINWLIALGLSISTIVANVIDFADKYRVIYFKFPFVGNRGITFWDFETQCRAHDYCWDLIRARNSNNERLYPNVHASDCNDEFHNAMKYDCSERGAAKFICDRVAWIVNFSVGRVSP